jgi:hypothetical protein
VGSLTLWHSRSRNAVQLLPEAVRLANGNADASDVCEVGKVAPQPNRRRPKTKASDGLSAALRFGLRTSSSPAVRYVVVRVACCAAWRLHAGQRAGYGVCRLVDARARPDAAGRGRSQRCSLFAHSPPSVVCCASRFAPRRVLACKSRRYCLIASSSCAPGTHSRRAGYIDALHCAMRADAHEQRLPVHRLLSTLRFPVGAARSARSALLWRLIAGRALQCKRAVLAAAAASSRCPRAPRAAALARRESRASLLL